MEREREREKERETNWIKHSSRRRKRKRRRTTATCSHLLPPSSGRGGSREAAGSGSGSGSDSITLVPRCLSLVRHSWRKRATLQESCWWATIILFIAFLCHAVATQVQYVSIVRVVSPSVCKIRRVACVTCGAALQKSTANYLESVHESCPLPAAWVLHGGSNAGLLTTWQHAGVIGMARGPRTHTHEGSFDEAGSLWGSCQKEMWNCGGVSCLEGALKVQREVSKLF